MTGASPRFEGPKFLVGFQFCQIGDWAIVSEAADRFLSEENTFVTIVACLAVGETIPSAIVAPSDDWRFCFHCWSVSIVQS